MIERGCPEHITRRGFLLMPIVLSGLALPTDTLQGRAARGVIMYGGPSVTITCKTVRIRRLYSTR
jgi:hypothetical protein